MGKINYDWVNQQMQDAKVRVGTGKAIMKMLKAWEEIEVSPEQGKEIFEILGKLALNYSIIETPKDEVWIGVVPGNFKVGDEVRIAHNAFDGDLGVLHNGRRGKIIAVRSGDVIFKSTDGVLPSLDGVHYSPYKLEKRIR
jgi:hypothetical protein